MTPEPRPWPISICTTAGLSALATSCTLEVEPGSEGAATVGVVGDVPEDSPWLHATAPTVASSAAPAPTASQTRLRPRGLSAGASTAVPGSSAGGSSPCSPGGAISWSGSGGGRKSATGGVAGRSRHVRRGGSTGVGVVSTGMRRRYGPGVKGRVKGAVNPL